MPAGRQVFDKARRSCGLVFRALVAFLARPSLDRSPSSQDVSPAVTVIWLLIFSLAATAAFALAALPLALSSGAGPGENLTRVFERPLASVILAVIVLGPLVEEMMFRGWLKGTARAFVGTSLFLGIWFGGAALLTERAPGATGAGALVGLAAFGLAAYVGVTRSGPATPMSWFRPLFPVAFWLQGLVFGALHFVNAESPSVGLSVLLTMPFVICGWLWGYARVTLGLGPAWLLHMAYNVPAVVAMMALPAVDLLRAGNP